MNTATLPPDGDDYDRFAPFYDLEFAEFDDDWPLYRAFADHSGGPILELGCGTGRLVVPLAEAGYDVVGVDRSPAMLGLARAAVERAGVRARVTLVEDDMRTLDTLGQRRFRLAFCAINSFLHLGSQEEQLAALGAIFARLDPGGVLLLDLFPPHPDILDEYDGRLIHAGTYHDPATGERIDKLSTTVLDSAEQRMDTTFFYDRLRADGRVERVAAPFTFRYVGRYELQLLLERVGYTAVAFYGSYDLEPFTAASDRMIAVAVRPE
jgi:SAM-dependent methyltransferase